MPQTIGAPRGCGSSSAPPAWWATARRAGSHPGPGSGVLRASAGEGGAARTTGPASARRGGRETPRRGRRGASALFFPRPPGGDLPVPEAGVVATARSPIGRAMKGSLKELRPDDLTATIIRAALEKVPELDPKDIVDLHLGCGLPGGESGFNMGRVVAVMLGFDHLPGATITRYCSSSLQTTRMAFHAIKAGEGDCFISAGVETVSRFIKGSSDSWPDTQNSMFAEAVERTDQRSKGGGESWQDPREDSTVPDVYIAMGQTAANVAQLKGVTREEQDEFGVRSQNLAEKAIANGFFEREIVPG